MGLDIVLNECELNQRQSSCFGSEYKKTSENGLSSKVDKTDKHTYHSPLHVRVLCDGLVSPW